MAVALFCIMAGRFEAVFLCSEKNKKKPSVAWRVINIAVRPVDAVCNFYPYYPCDSISFTGQTAISEVYLRQL
jgi:hypothetical protein